jgi:hypothetical protein
MQRAGQKRLDLDRLYVELLGQGADVVAMPGQDRFEMGDLPAEHAGS